MGDGTARRRVRSLSERLTVESRPIPGCEQYRVRIDGRVLGQRGKPMCVRRTPSGYPFVTIRRNGKNWCKAVHSLVALAWLRPKPSPLHEVAHNDGDKENSRPDNLEWKTHAENGEDARKHGSMAHGERHPFAKLNSGDIQGIKVGRRMGLSYDVLAAGFGVNASAIGKILRGERWARSREPSL